MEFINKHSLAFLSIFTFSIIAFSFDEKPQKVEQAVEYAHVYVEDRGKSKIVSVSKAGVEVDINNLKSKKREDYGLVMGVLENLNKEGYEVVSSSMSNRDNFLYFSYVLKKTRD